MRQWKRNMLNHLFYGYLKCLKKTVRMEWIHPEVFEGNHVVGFWHEDSFAMNLILSEISARGKNVDVLVTADERGEYIQYLIEKCGGKAVRIGYGFCNAGILKELLGALKEENRSVAIAMDGPLGPRHIPKKLTYVLSENSQKSLVGVTLSYSGKVSLLGRWDHYHIPLPFSKLTVRFDSYGVVSARKPAGIRICQNEEECSIMTGIPVENYKAAGQM